MQSTATTVDDYLETVPPERLPALTRLRRLCAANLHGYTEGMDYGMPSYSKDGEIQIAFNSQKNYISLYILNKEVLDRYRHNFKDIGKGCIRYRNPGQMDFALIETILAESTASNAEICP